MRTLLVTLILALSIVAARAATLPVLSSHPSAPASIYLDFDGEPAHNWGFNPIPATPAYDTDGDPSTFTVGEAAAIDQIWARVAEKYAPFNVNVTTVKPASFANRVAMYVLIGGSGEWAGSGVGGIAGINSFTNPNPNGAYVFSANYGGDPKSVAESVAHEAGHTFGLSHKSRFDGTTLISEYDTGDALTAPIMGISTGAARGLWSYGQTPTGTWQDDLAILAGANNGFGYRTDDHGDTTATVGGGPGIIERPGDVDVFALPAGIGYELALPLGAMLDPSVTEMLIGDTRYVSVSGPGDGFNIGSYSIIVPEPSLVVLAFAFVLAARW